MASNLPDGWERCGSFSGQPMFIRNETKSTTCGRVENVPSVVAYVRWELDHWACILTHKTKSGSDMHAPEPTKFAAPEAAMVWWEINHGKS